VIGAILPVLLQVAPGGWPRIGWHHSQVDPVKDLKVGSVLVALPSESNVSSIFSRSVVVILEHEHFGSYGVVLNKQLRGRLSSEGAPRLRAGGPVHREQRLYLHGTAVRGSQVIPGQLPHSTQAYFGEIAPTNLFNSVSSAALVGASLREGVSDGGVPAIALDGCARWGPGQLDREVRRSLWAWIPPEPRSGVPNLVVELLRFPHLSEMWESMIQRAGLRVFDEND